MTLNAASSALFRSTERESLPTLTSYRARTANAKCTRDFTHMRAQLYTHVLCVLHPTSDLVCIFGGSEFASVLLLGVPHDDDDDIRRR